MELSELLTRLPNECSVEMVDRKVIDRKSGQVKEYTSIDIVHARAGTPLRFSSIEDVSAALDLARIIAGDGPVVIVQQRIDPPELPLNGHSAAEPLNGLTLDEIALEPDEADAPAEERDDDEIEPVEPVAPPPPPRSIAPGGPVASQFQMRVQSRKAKDKIAIVPAVPASV